MKSTISLTLSFLVIFALISDLPLAFSKNAPDLVKDTNGNPILSDGSTYYILPLLRGPGGGGVWLGKTGNQKCPVTVLQDYSEVVRGEAVKFEHFPNIGIIYEGVPLKISFDNIYGYCAESTEWVVVSDGYPRRWVGVGGAEDHPRKEIVSGYFDIRKFGDIAYKLVFCPTAGGGSPDTCFNIGRRDGKKGRRLILAEEDDPTFAVVFAKAAPDAVNGIKSIV